MNNKSIWSVHAKQEDNKTYWLDLSLLCLSVLPCSDWLQVSAEQGHVSSDWSTVSPEQGHTASHWSTVSPAGCPRVGQLCHRAPRPPCHTTFHLRGDVRQAPVWKENCEYGLYQVHGYGIWPHGILIIVHSRLKSSCTYDAKYVHTVQ